MAVTINCTHCQASLSMPESMAGRQVRCPKCQQIFNCPAAADVTASPPPRAPAPAPPPQPARQGAGGTPFSFDEPAAPEPSSRSSRRYEEDERAREDDGPIIRAPRTAWGGVTRGLMFLTISAGVYMLMYLVLYLLSKSMGPGSGGAAVLVLMCLLLVSANALAGIGLGMLMGLPSTTSARGVAIAGMASMGVATLSSLVLSIMIIGAMSSGGGSNSMGYFFLFTLCGLLGGFLFAQLFMVIVAKHMNANGLLGSVVGMMGFWTIAPWFILGMAGMGELLGGFGGGRRGGMGGPGGPSNPVDLFLIIVLGAGAWFITNAMLISNAINTARRKGAI